MDEFMQAAILLTIPSLRRFTKLSRVCKVAK